MGKPPAYDPVSEIEYLVTAGLKDAEADDILRFVASTYDPGARSRRSGHRRARGRASSNFAPLLDLGAVPAECS